MGNQKVEAIALTTGVLMIGALAAVIALFVIGQADTPIQELVRAGNLAIAAVVILFAIKIAGVLSNCKALLVFGMTGFLIISIGWFTYPMYLFGTKPPSLHSLFSVSPLGAMLLGISAFAL